MNNPQLQHFALTLQPEMSVRDFLGMLGGLMEQVGSHMAMDSPLKAAQFNPTGVVFGFAQNAGDCNWEMMILGENGLCTRCNHTPDDHEKESCQGCRRSK